MTKAEVLVASMQAARPGTTKEEAIRFIAEAMPNLRLDLWDGSADDVVAEQIIREASSNRVVDIQAVAQRIG